MFNSKRETNKKFKKKIWLSSPTMHGDELKYMMQAYDTNWMSTVGQNIDEVERIMAEKIGNKFAVGLSSGTAALHLALKLAGERIYGLPKMGKGSLHNKKVFVSDLTFCATVNPVVYEGGIPVFIDSERNTWNMDPEALEKAFEIYPEVKIVVSVNLYGVPAKMDELRRIVKKHNAILIEDAAESLGATYKGKQTGTFGTYNCISFNGNKIITGSSGGMLLTDNGGDADKIRKWSTQAREKAPWYQHEEIGFNYRMSNVIAGVVRGQTLYLEEHIAQKKEIYFRYKEGFKDLPIQMNPYDESSCKPNFWLSCMIIEKNAMCKQVRSENEASFLPEKGKSCPVEILKALSDCNVEGRSIWKPLSSQPIFRQCDVITKKGSSRASSNAYIEGNLENVALDIFHRGLCLPSDNKMTEKEQREVIKIVRACFN